MGASSSNRGENKKLKPPPRKWETCRHPSLSDRGLAKGKSLQQTVTSFSFEKVSQNVNITHTIHVWYIYLHLVDFYGKCRKISHTWMVWVISHSITLSHLKRIRVISFNLFLLGCFDYLAANFQKISKNHCLPESFVGPGAIDLWVAPTQKCNPTCKIMQAGLQLLFFWQSEFL